MTGGPAFRRPARYLAGLVAALSLVLGSCRAEPPTPVQAPRADPELGRQHAADFGCGACHVIPGVRGARGQVAAPLEAFSRRHFIAGKIPNNADNLTAWIRDPQQVDPGTAMPNLGVSEQQARDIAAYLLSLD